MKKQHIAISKYLSLVLRHKPGAIGLVLDANGWAAIDDLINRATANGRKIDRKIIEEVVATNDKQRFCISSDGKRIRANQGHSIHVDLGLTPTKPPAFLYHGTAVRFLESIYQTGLHPSGRQYVHLSSDEATAMMVGKRHGQPAILIVESGIMDSNGHVFYRSENGVWLTKNVPPEYLKPIDSDCRFVW
jgi:putative RNA 2'-phosphotransferase